MPDTNYNQNYSTQNQFDANEAYGLNESIGCQGGNCPQNSLNQGYNIPSLQEIAAYNQMTSPQQTSAQNQYQGNLQQVPAVSELENIDATQPPLPPTTTQTPATTLDYGETINTTMQNNLGTAITDILNPYPVTPESIQYLNGFIRTQIGRRLTIDFLIGSNNLVSKTGYLLGVAQNYILINELDTNDITTCDFYNIKFIRFYY